METMVHPAGKTAMAWSSALRRGRLGILLLLAAATPTLAQEYKIVVHQDQAPGGLTEAEVSRLFLKKETRWPDGTLVRPVLFANERMYEAFCRRIHRKTPSAVHAYWNQMMFSGVEVPPPERHSVAEVLDFVRTTPGAIGVVPADTATNGLRVVVVRGE